MNNCVILVSSVKDWKCDGILVKDIIQISLTNEPTTDDVVVLMIASNKWDVSKLTLVWGSDFIKHIDNTMVNNLVSGGKRHHGCRGEFKGFGTSHKFVIKDNLSFGKFSRKYKQSHNNDIAIES